MIAFTITRDAITLVLNGASHAIPRTSPQADSILEALRNPPYDETELAELVEREYTVESYTDGQCTIMKDGTVTRLGIPLPKVLADKVIECYEDGSPYSNLLAFFDRLLANPSKTAVEELYTFLEHKGMPVTPEGRFLAYKGIRNDGFSQRGGDNSKVVRGVTDDSGHIRNWVGDEIEVVRNYVEDNRDVGCASGLHAGSLSYASSWGDKVVIVSIDPADVVSIPTDCECQKLRTCAYKVVAEAQGMLRDSAVRNENCPYSDPEPEEDPYDEYEISIEDIEDQLEADEAELDRLSAVIAARELAQLDKENGTAERPVCILLHSFRMVDSADSLFSEYCDAYADAMK